MTAPLFFSWKVFHLSIDSGVVSFQNQTKNVEVPTLQRVDSKNKEILEFYDPCLNCMSSSFLRDFLGHHGCFVTPREAIISSSNLETSDEFTDLFANHLRQLIGFLSGSLSVENRADWVRTLNSVVPARVFQVRNRQKPMYSEWFL